GVHLWLRQWNAAGGGSRLLRHEPRWDLLSASRQTQPAHRSPCRLAMGPMGLDLLALRLRQLWAVTRLRHLLRARLLRPHHRWAVSPAENAAGCRAALPRSWLSCTACDV